MNCAPILITTLNRHEHFIRLIESLRKNTWAKYTPVYIALDFPPSEKYVDGYSKICDYLKGDFSDFGEFHIIRRNENYGSLRNMAEMRDEILQRYDTFIRTDDDAEFSPNFLEFMNKCLEKYKDCDDVIAVTGYSYPIKWTVSPESNVLPINFNASMWGTGFWKHKYLKMKEDIEAGMLLTKQSGFILIRALINMIDVAKCEYVNLCFSKNCNVLVSKVSDISMRIYIAITNQYVIIPLISKVRNWGFDGSGACCPDMMGLTDKKTSTSYNYSEQPIDDQLSFDVIEDVEKRMLRNRCALNRFDNISVGKKIRLIIKLLIYFIFGEQIYMKVFLK